MATAQERGGGATRQQEDQQRIHKNEGEKRFETEDKAAYLEYRLINGGRVMEIFDIFVPPGERDSGLAGRLCVAAFSHARSLDMPVVPTCPYVSDTFLERNPEWKPDVRDEDRQRGERQHRTTT